MVKLIILISMVLCLLFCKEHKEVLVLIKTDGQQSPPVSKDGQFLSLPENKNDDEKSQAKDPAGEWLKTLFECTSGNHFCFYL